MRLLVTAGPAGNSPQADHCINRLNQRRGLAMRTDKPAVHYQAALTVAAILLRTRT